ncbi:MAG TPA: class I SAM-dependent methyltransferase [Pyrinomonadaceae bacterium]|nr:class I SAM-dependent methyltransferase [Pyrinomonadaceae bacterium]
MQQVRDEANMSQGGASRDAVHGVVYEGRDLEAMSFAENYHRWILEIFEPYLGSRLVEVGAGTGAFSELILGRRPESLSLVEPSEEMYRILRGRVAGLETATQVSTYNSIFAQVADEIDGVRRPDSIIYVNVLEHIADDEAELKIVRRALCDGGRAFIFVPALPWLYGSFDERIGHCRRYTKGELEEKCRRAGFRVLRSEYFDLAGILPWWIKYRLLRSRKMEAGGVKFYDRFVVPAIKLAETTIPPPVGKNIVLIGEKV